MDSRQLWAQQSQPTQEHRQPFPPGGQSRTRGQPGAQSSNQHGLQTQDWVSKRRPPLETQTLGGLVGEGISISIDERRRLAVLGTPSQDRAITQMVAELVSEDVDKDVLLAQPSRSAESTNAFYDFLARSTPFWQSATLKSQASGSPGS
uniref:Testis expressed 22 n=1 Tax=Spermophilus dauricus TaxID=99837 RepID=A0A8C9QCU1_SPEDA